MKDKFPGYYLPDFSALWKTATFVVDASSLLNIYGYSPDTRNEILVLIENIVPRVWLPYQFAMEYQRNRIAAICEQINNYEEMTKDLRSIDERFRARNRHPFALDKQLLEVLPKLQKDLSEGLAAHEALLRGDPYFERISTIFEGRVGPGFPPDQLATLHDEAKKRYADSIPPGYEDMAKPEPHRYGDFVAWQEILTSSAKAATPVVLITDDSKRDWWQVHERGKRRTIGPRPELIAEFRKVVGKDFFMYSTDQFLLNANTYLAAKVEQQAIEEVSERLQSLIERILETKVPASPETSTEKPTPEKPPAHVTSQDASTPKADPRAVSDAAELKSISLKEVPPAESQKPQDTPAKLVDKPDPE